MTEPALTALDQLLEMNQELELLRWDSCHHLLPPPLSSLWAKSASKAEPSWRGNIGTNRLTRLFHEHATRIDLDVIDQLCGYFGCEVGEDLKAVFAVHALAAFDYLR